MFWGITHLAKFWLHHAAVVHWSEECKPSAYVHASKRCCISSLAPSVPLLPFRTHTVLTTLKAPCTGFADAHHADRRRPQRINCTRSRSCIRRLCCREGSACAQYRSRTHLHVAWWPSKERGRPCHPWPRSHQRIGHAPRDWYSELVLAEYSVVFSPFRGWPAPAEPCWRSGIAVHATCGEATATDAARAHGAPHPGAVRLVMFSVDCSCYSACAHPWVTHVPACKIERPTFQD